MTNKVDINEYNLLKGYSQDVLDILLTDRSVTKYKNDGMTHHIFWATHDYEALAKGIRIMTKLWQSALQENILMLSYREL